MPFYPAKGGNSGKNLRVFWGGMNVRSDTYSDKMPTDTDLNILYEFNAQHKDAFPWVGDNSYYVQVRVYRISEKSKKLKRIRMRAFQQAISQLMMQSANNNAQVISEIRDVGNQVKNCCCEIKTQMLTDRLADVQAEKLTLQNALSNAQQTQSILSSLGRYVAWAGAGNQGGASAVVATGA